MAPARDPAGKAGRSVGGEGLESSLALLRRAQAGDRQALDRLCTRYLPPLRRWASGRLPGWARGLVDTDDIVQDCLLRTLPHLDHFKPRHDGALQAYLRQALGNRIREEIRRVEHRPQPGDSPGDLRAIEPSPVVRIVGRENFERYQAALARLRPADHEAIVLRIERDYDYAALARALGKATPNAARVAVMRALVRLGEEMSHA